MPKKEIAKGVEDADFLKLDLSKPGSKDWEEAIRIFDVRFRFRYIEPVDVLIQHEALLPAQDRKFGFTIAAIDALLIETLACFYEGLPQTPDRRNRTFYCAFMTDPQTVLSKYFNVETAKHFYEDIRCGILHQSETKQDAKIWSVGPVVTLHGNSIRINRTALHEVLKEEFDQYTHKLKDPANDTLRENFVTKMRSICGV